MKKDLVRVKISQIQEPEKPQREGINRANLEELAESMKTRGLLQPILLKKSAQGYQIEAGHRRFLAAQMLYWEEIDAIILPETDEDELHLDRAHENLIREDLNPVEEARLVWDIVHNDGQGIERAAKLIGKTTNWIESRLEIHKLPEDLKEALKIEKIKIRVAFELAKVKDEGSRKTLLESVIEHGATSNTVKRWVEDYRTGDYLAEHKVLQDQGDILPIERSQITMPCRICGLSHEIDILRHIWCCPDCLAVVRELSRETQKQLQE